MWITICSMAFLIPRLPKPSPFCFKRDLELLGLKNPNPDDNYYLALDNFWSAYEIMGVSLVDIRVWEWL